MNHSKLVFEVNRLNCASIIVDFGDRSSFSGVRYHKAMCF